MKQLNYDVLKETGYQGFIEKDAPERIIQFGEGNFLRGFVDYFVDIMNEKSGFHSKVLVVQPIARGLRDIINTQEGLYTLYLRGFQDGQKVNQKRVISSISRCMNPYDEFDKFMESAESQDLRFVVSNTTEAGIAYDPECRFEDAPASSFPGKLTQWLYHRYETFKEGHGMIILSCELIDDNGKELEKCVLKYAEQWNLGEEFIKWIEKENIFCATLVDRIVTGYPRSEVENLNMENSYEDQLVDTAEIFGLWVIEAPQELGQEIPFEKAGLPVIITDNHKPYKQRKVRILNGAHTSFVLGAYLAGEDIVRNCMNDETIRTFMDKTVYDEIIPTLDLPEQELKDFAAAVTERFKNPYIDHKLLDISLNSTSKWKARVLPSLLEYVKRKGTLPSCITASMAFYIQFYRGIRWEEDGIMIARRESNEYPVKDDLNVLKFYMDRKDAKTEDLVHDVLSNTDFWGQDLTQVPGFENAVLQDMEVIQESGARKLMENMIR